MTGEASRYGMGERMTEQSNELVIRDLHVKVENREILKGLNLTVRPGKVHAIMGPNGSGRARWPTP
jgi:Fe-S cluster assembly ATP-binding protein